MNLDYSFIERAVWGKGCFIEDYLLLAGVVAMLKPRTILEIGTSTGLGAVWLHRAAKRWRGDALVTTLDVDQSHGRDNTFLIPGSVDEIEFVEGATDDVLPRWAREGRRFDLVFVDGDHGYAQARRDWMNTRELTFIWALHDTTQHTGLQRLVSEIRELGQYDVFQFVAAPGHRHKYGGWQVEGFVTGMTLVQDRRVLRILGKQAHRDDDGKLLPGHGERDVPRLPLLCP